MKAIFRKVPFSLYVVGIIGSLLGGYLVPLAMDLGLGKKVLSRHLLTEMAVPVGVKKATDMVYPMPDGYLMEETELIMDSKDLQNVGSDSLRTPFEFSYGFFTKDGARVYGGAGGPLCILRSQMKHIGGRSGDRVRVVGRNMIYRAEDAGPVILEVTLIAPSNVFLENPVVRLYDGIKKSDGILNIGFALMVFAPFVALIGLILFVHGVVKQRI